MPTHVYYPSWSGRESAVGIDDYLDGAPEPQRSTLLVLRSTLRELLPDAEEALSYGMPALVVGETDRWFRHGPSALQLLPALRCGADRAR